MQLIEALKQTLVEIDSKLSTTNGRIAALEKEREDLQVAAKTVRELLAGDSEELPASTPDGRSDVEPQVKKTLAWHFEAILRESDRAMKTAEIFDEATRRGVPLKSKNTAYSILSRYDQFSKQGTDWVLKE